HRVSPHRVFASYTYRRSAAVDVVKVILQIALLFMKEALAVGEQQLHVTRLRTVDRRIINLVQRAVRDRKPDSAGSRVGCRHRVLLARGPAWFQSRSPECGSVIFQPA